ncbi:hypothetical protein IFM89_006552 [Coptis chinensis]|uniref:Uncharacterized protein n=1 Tax=Coptis chinensis TaxID=261450 RepID=A0A835IK77_9MAGN|nr:hypothetical protein IFM89_006552 [Coptis chinensis]
MLITPSYPLQTGHSPSEGVAMQLMRQGAMLTVLSTLLAVLAWLATLLATTDFIDNKWLIPIGVGNFPTNTTRKLCSVDYLETLHHSAPLVEADKDTTEDPKRDKLERHLADAQMFDMAWMVTHNGGAAIKYDTKFVCRGMLA